MFLNCLVLIRLCEQPVPKIGKVKQSSDICTVAYLKKTTAFLIAMDCFLVPTNDNFLKRSCK